MASASETGRAIPLSNIRISRRAVIQGIGVALLAGAVVNEGQVSREIDEIKQEVASAEQMEGESPAIPDDFAERTHDRLYEEHNIKIRSNASLLAAGASAVIFAEGWLHSLSKKKATPPSDTDKTS